MSDQQLRVDQVGSLLRPEPVKHALVEHLEGRLDEAALRRHQDDAVRELVAAQEAIGLPVITDGEVRRLHFQESFADVRGMPPWRLGDNDYDELMRAPAEPGLDRKLIPRQPATERLQLVRNRPLSEYRFASLLTDRRVKVTLLGPHQIARGFTADAPDSAYRDLDDFLVDVVKVEREIVGGLVDAGCRYVQVDEPGFTLYVDPPSLADLRDSGEDPDRFLGRAIEAANAMIAGFDGVTFGLHVCRGNRAGHWHREGGYDAIAERLFTSLDHERLLLEYDSDRAGGFEPLRFVPEGKIAVLGLISSKTSELESRDFLIRRIEEATRYLPVEQLAISPQCGFASNAQGNPLTEAIQWRKLELMLETATRVWGGPLA